VPESGDAGVGGPSAIEPPILRWPLRP
jgi:hypothetical protein